MSSLWTLEKLRQRGLSLCSRSTVGVQRATNRGWSAKRDNEGGWGNDRKLPSTNMEQQPPCCSLKALEVCRQHTKLLCAEGQHRRSAESRRSLFVQTRHAGAVLSVRACCRSPEPELRRSMLAFTTSASELSTMSQKVSP